MARSSSRFRAAQERSDIDLFKDLLWFGIHSIVAEAVLAGTIASMSLFSPEADSLVPKVAATVLALAVPFVAALVLARVWVRDPRLGPARYCWIAGLILLVSAMVWVSGMPRRTGTGFDAVWRTLFALRNGTGLLNGDGLLIGCWAPLATFGYSAGAWVGRRA